MKEFLELLKKLDLKGIFVTPTKNEFLQFFRYIFVGGIATVADWGTLYLLTEYAHVYHLVSAVIAFTVGLIVNFILSRLLVFSANEAKTGKALEFIGYAVIGVIGLGITEGIMFLLTNQLGAHYMLSKAIATVVVLVWNYIARKKLLYKD